MNTFRQSAFFLIICFASTSLFADGHGSLSMEACNEKFAQVMVGKWQGQFRFRDGDTQTINTWDTIAVNSIEDGVMKSEWSNNGGNGAEEAPVSSLQWETSISWINEDSTIVSLTYCHETETGITREFSWTGTQTSTGDEIETITQQVIFSDDSGYVVSVRGMNINDEPRPHYVWGWGHSSKVD